MSAPYIFTQDVQSNKNYPSFEYAPTETGGSYHEDREVGGTLFRAVNAKFNDTSSFWSQPDLSQPSNALIHYPDGSVGYVYMPAGSSTDWSTSDWQGFGQKPVYNAVSFGLTTTDLTGTTNAAALTAAISTVLGAGGGTLLIPAGTYLVYGSISISSVGSAGIIIAGVSGQTRLIQQTASDIFDVSGINADEGVRFRDLYFSYAPFDPGMSTYAAINVQDSNAVTCERVYFENCPTAFETDNRCEFCGLFNCWIYYNLQTGGDDSTPVNGQTMISLSGAEDFVSNCVLHQNPINNTPEAGPDGCTGIMLRANNSSRFISDTHVSDFAYGVKITDNVGDLSFSGVRIDAYENAVLIMPAETTGTIYTVHFTNCTFANTLYGNTLSKSPTSGVVISTNGGANSNVSGIYFANCEAYGWSNAGIEIDSGENIAIVGGQYSSNGQAPSETYLGAGIAVAGMTGGADEVTVSGADCSGISAFWQGSAMGTPVTQPYGIAISGLVSDVTVTGCLLAYNNTGGLLVTTIDEAAPEHIYIRACNARAYSSYSVAMNVASSATDVQITDCAGYNDQGAILHTPSTPPPASFENTTYGYRGPITFYVWGTGASSMTIGTLLVPLTTGGFLLPCGVSGKVVFTGSPSFAVVGM